MSCFDGEIGYHDNLYCSFESYNGQIIIGLLAKPLEHRIVSK